MRHTLHGRRLTWSNSCCDMEVLDCAVETVRTAVAGESGGVRADVPVSLHPDALLPLAAALDPEGTAKRRAYAAIQDAERTLLEAAPPAARTQLPRAARGSPATCGPAPAD